jgi:hypothetical protein
MPQSLQALQHLLRITKVELANIEALLLTTTSEVESTRLIDKAAILHLKEREIRALLGEGGENIAEPSQ